MRRLGKVLLAAMALALLAAFAAALSLRLFDPPGSRLMALRAAEGVVVRHEWTPLQAISPQLVASVIAHEDPRICAHWGVDWPRIRAAMEVAEDGAPEDTSTIAMQTVKNLVLWPERSYARKALEIPLAYALTLALPRWRIVEIYLNVAEWGGGAFGIGAAAAHHFGKAAGDLNAREAALLAAALPNPHLRNAGRAGPRTRALAERIANAARASPDAAACILSGREQREALANAGE